MAGFPCQPFSTAGMRKGEHDFRGKVIHNVVDTIEKSLPKAFILENVVGFQHAAGGKLLRKVLDRLESIKDTEAGRGHGRAYDISHEVVNAVDHGVPQSRRRLFIVGIHRKLRLCL